MHNGLIISARCICMQMHTFVQSDTHFKHIHTQFIYYTRQLEKKHCQILCQSQLLNMPGNRDKSKQLCSLGEHRIAQNLQFGLIRVGGCCAFSSLVSVWFILCLTWLTSASSEGETYVLKAALILITTSSKNSSAYSVASLTPL